MTINVTQEPLASTFNLSIPLYQQGGERRFLTNSSLFRLAIASCAQGFGEKELHMHADEDHAFVVLQGSARFYFESQDGHHLQQWQGIFLPRGVVYGFEAIEGLVMLRIGAFESREQPEVLTVLGEPIERTDYSGLPLDRDVIAGVREVAIPWTNHSFP